jgi:hypothetical protein
MGHYDEQFEKDILEASISIRNEAKDNNIEQVFTEEDLSNYLAKVALAKKDKLKTDYIVGDITEEKLLEGITPDKAHIDLVQPVFVEDVNDPWHPLFSGIEVDEDFSEILDNIRKPMLKDTKGKAAGARYCYLDDIANVVLGSVKDSKGYRDTMSAVGETLSTIVRAYDKGWMLDVKHYCAVMIQDLLELDVSLHHELIKVRAQALDSGKYTPEGYRDELDVTLLMDAAARHFIKKLMVGDIDEESGCTHEAHIAANIIMINTQIELHYENIK